MINDFFYDCLATRHQNFNFGPYFLVMGERGAWNKSSKIYILPYEQSPKSCISPRTTNLVSNLEGLAVIFVFVFLENLENML